MPCRTYAEYEDELKRWQETCAAMAAEEQHARALSSPGCCELSLYWVQQCAALGLELPLRLSYHAGTMALASCCCVPIASLCCSSDCSMRTTALRDHHHELCQQYCSLTHMLANNICQVPSHPWYVYQADVSLQRPPKPQPPPPRSGCCDDECDCDCKKDCACDCDDVCDGDCAQKIQSLANRHVRSLLCCFSCHHSCHPA
eukprot:6814771-Prymnesium_polylepis.1